MNELVNRLLENQNDPDWTPDWQPSPEILAWFRNFLNRTGPGVWVSPGSGQIYNLNPQTKTATLIKGSPHDPLHWHDKNKVTMRRLGWTVLDGPNDHPEQMSFGERLTAVEIRNELLEESISPFTKTGVTLQYRPFRLDGDWQWAWVLLPDDRSKALGHGQGSSRAAAAVDARREARRLGVVIAKIGVIKPAK